MHSLDRSNLLRGNRNKDGRWPDTGQRSAASGMTGRCSYCRGSGDFARNVAGVVSACVARPLMANAPEAVIETSHNIVWGPCAGVGQDRCRFGAGVAEGRTCKFASARTLPIFASRSFLVKYTLVLHARDERPFDDP